MEETHRESPPATGAGIRQIQSDLMALTKARLSVLVVLTTCFGYSLGTKGIGSFSMVTLFHLIFGTALAAAGASVFNQLMEVEADARMIRTSDRPLPSRRLPKPAAFVIGWVLAAFGIVHLGVKVNTPASILAGATLLTYLFVYTPLKRVSSINTIVGAVSGALPPLIGWAAAFPDSFASLWRAGALFVFVLLFLWQLPHFAAINWMYRDEYLKGGFRMWSNDDPDGARTALIAIVSALLLTFATALFPVFFSEMAIWGIIPMVLLGSPMVFLALRFRRTGERKDARTLFFYTLLYLPLVMVASYLAWRSIQPA